MTYYKPSTKQDVRAAAAAGAGSARAWEGSSNNKGGSGSSSPLFWVALGLWPHGHIGCLPTRDVFKGSCVIALHGRRRKDGTWGEREEK